MDLTESILLARAARKVARSHPRATPLVAIRGQGVYVPPAVQTDRAPPSVPSRQAPFAGRCRLGWWSAGFSLVSCATSLRTDVDERMLPGISSGHQRAIWADILPYFPTSDVERNPLLTCSTPPLRDSCHVGEHEDMGVRKTRPEQVRART